jgi:hypothetical protein
MPPKTVAIANGLTSLNVAWTDKDYEEMEFVNQLAKEVKEEQ